MSTASQMCPDPASLASLADGTLGESARAAVVAHVADCEECQDAVVMLVEMDGRPAPPLPASLKSAGMAVIRPHVVRRWQPLAAAAVVLLSVGGWYFVQQKSAIVRDPAGVSDDRVRSGPSDSHVPHVIRPTAGQRVRRSTVGIEWRQTSAALTYRVRVMKDDGQLLWEHETPGTTALVPEATPLPAGVPLYISVTAVLPDGKTSRAPAVKFEVE